MCYESGSYRPNDTTNGRLVFLGAEIDSRVEISPAPSQATSFSIRHGDVLDRLSEVPDRSVQLVVSSPPYNIGKSYERECARSLQEYVDWQTEVCTELSKKIVPGGSICWQVGSYVKGGEVTPLDIVFFPIFRELGLTLRNRIIWRFNFGLNSDRRFSGRYETILWLTLGDDYKFNLDPVRIPQLYPGKRHSASKGAKAGTLSGNPKGKNPSDYWEFSALEDFQVNPVWEIPNVKANHPEKTAHPCQFPVELAERCILALTSPGDVVLDPFVGAGATAIAAVKHGRTAIGIDKQEDYVRLATERCELMITGQLKTRPAGLSVRPPKLGEKVASMPPEWLADQ